MSCIAILLSVRRLVARRAPRVVCALLAVVASVAPARAQGEIPPDVQEPWPYDTGWVSNDGPEPQVVADFVVAHPWASTLRLRFGDVELSGEVSAGTGSALRVTSLLDGAQQTLDAAGLRAWHGTSAYFNGGSLLVEVVVFPGTGRNRVVLQSLDAGLPLAPPPVGICGTTDDRVRSNDPFVARLMPSGCTGWLVQDCFSCMLSAGHCAGGIDVVEFDVPPSTPGGSLQHPPPEDQYPVDPASLKFANAGPGADWAYYGTLANTSTGLTVQQTQGAGFPLVPAPPVTGQAVRVTGYGVDTSPLVDNQVQQTSTGPLLGAGGATLEFGVDVQGGNSGSPLLLDGTGEALGIVTHAGCLTASGANIATSQLVLEAVLAAPRGVCRFGPFALIADLGGGKTAFPFGVPVLDACGTLEPDSPLTLSLRAAPQLAGSTGTTTLVLGLSPLGAPFHGGTLVPAPDLVLGGLPLSGNGTTFTLVLDTLWPAALPSGTSIWVQHWLAIKPLLLPPVELASNGLRLTGA